jgi:hypothetical protein
MRAAHIARNVTTKAAAEVLQETADVALQKQVAEVVRGLRIYVMIDVSGSMQASIEAAKTYLSRFVQGFPMDHLHAAIFNSQGREVTIRHASAAGVTVAFTGVHASGGTDYGAGVRALAHHKYVGHNVGDAATEDDLFLFVGDKGQHGDFSAAVRSSGLSPIAFGLLRLPGENFGVVDPCPPNEATPHHRMLVRPKCGFGA